MFLCSHGCGKEGKFQSPWTGRWRCEKSSNNCPKLRELNAARQRESYRNGRVSAHKVHPAAGWNTGSTKRSLHEIFAKDSEAPNYQLKWLIEYHKLLEFSCSECGLDSWLGKSLVLELDHINGIRSDNRLENLRLLCPNCHSQTETFRGRNRCLGKATITDEQLIEAIKTTSNKRQALIKVGLAARGANYFRVRSLVENYNLTFKKAE